MALMTVLRLATGLALCAGPVFAGTASEPEFPALATMDASSQSLAPGVTYTSFVSDGGNGAIAWSVSFGVERTQEERRFVDHCASLLDQPSKVLSFQFPGARNVGYQERLVGNFSSQTDASAWLAERKLPTECAPTIKAGPQYPGDETSPWRIHVLKLDRNFTGRLEVARGDANAVGLAKPSDVRVRHNALAAINGGFFVMVPNDGIVGESAGISVIGGRLISEPARRPWALIENGSRIQVSVQTRDAQFLPRIRWADHSVTNLDGLNRDPHLLRNCGALNDPLYSAAWHDRTCYPRNQIVAFTENAGFVPAVGAGDVFAKVTLAGHIVSASPADTLKRGEYLLMATGSRAPLLRRKINPRLKASVELTAGPVSEDIFAVNGSPVLLVDGHASIREALEGWPFDRADRVQATEMHKFVVLRAPRSALGVTADGSVLLVVVDGHRFRDDKGPVVSMNGGATLAELRLIMQGLGARDAINLDGGGSSVVVGKRGVLSHPSDAVGERPVGDTLVVLAPASP